MCCSAERCFDTVLGHCNCAGMWPVPCHISRACQVNVYASRKKRKRKREAYLISRVMMGTCMITTIESCAHFIPCHVVPSADHAMLCSLHTVPHCSALTAHGQLTPFALCIHSSLIYSTLSRAHASSCCMAGSVVAVPAFTFNCG